MENERHHERHQEENCAEEKDMDTRCIIIAVS